MNQGPRRISLTKKNGGKKSRETIPLNKMSSPWILESLELSYMGGIHFRVLAVDLKLFQPTAETFSAVCVAWLVAQHSNIATTWV
jgi:hypothetical protein